LQWLTDNQYVLLNIEAKPNQAKLSIDDAIGLFYEIRKRKYKQLFIDFGEELKNEELRDWLSKLE